MQWEKHLWHKSKMVICCFWHQPTSVRYIPSCMYAGWAYCTYCWRTSKEPLMHLISPDLGAFPSQISCNPISWCAATRCIKLTESSLKCVWKAAISNNIGGTGNYTQSQVAWMHFYWMSHYLHWCTLESLVDIMIIIIIITISACRKLWLCKFCTSPNRVEEIF